MLLKEALPQKEGRPGGCPFVWCMPGLKTNRLQQEGTGQLGKTTKLSAFLQQASTPISTHLGHLANLLLY